MTPPAHLHRPQSRFVFRAVPTTVFNEYDWETFLAQYRAFNIISTAGLSLKWKDDDRLLAVNRPVLDVIYVLHEFSGQVFDHLRDLKCRIIGPLVVIQANEYALRLPMRQEPVWSMALREIPITLIGISTEDRDELAYKIIRLGGFYRSEIEDETRIIVMGDSVPNSSQMKLAKERQIHVLNRGWIEKIDEEAQKLIFECTHYCEPNFLDRFLIQSASPPQFSQTPLPQESQQPPVERLFWREENHDLGGEPSQLPAFTSRPDDFTQFLQANQAVEEDEDDAEAQEMYQQLRQLTSVAPDVPRGNSGVTSNLDGPSTVRPALSDGLSDRYCNGCVGRPAVAAAEINFDAGAQNTDEFRALSYSYIPGSRNKTGSLDPTTLSYQNQSEARSDEGGQSRSMPATTGIRSSQRTQPNPPVFAVPRRPSTSVAPPPLPVLPAPLSPILGHSDPPPQPSRSHSADSLDMIIPDDVVDEIEAEVQEYKRMKTTNNTTNGNRTNGKANKNAHSHSSPSVSASPTVDGLNRIGSKRSLSPILPAAQENKRPKPVFQNLGPPPTNPQPLQPRTNNVSRVSSAVDSRVLLFGQHETGATAGLIKKVDKFFTVRIIENFEPSLTHLVMGRMTRTEKLLCAMCTGKWVVNTEFIVDSIATKQWLHEDAYEYGNPMSRNRSLCSSDATMKFADGCYRWRVKRTSDPTFRGAFAGWRVLLYMGSRSKKRTFKKVIEVGGGFVTFREEISGTPRFAEFTAVLAQDNDTRVTRLEVQQMISNDLKCYKLEFMGAWLYEKNPTQLEWKEIYHPLYLSLIHRHNLQGSLQAEG